METKTIAGISLVIISSLLIVFHLLSPKEEFFNVRKTIHDHLHLFSACKFQYVVFYVFPLGFAIGLAMVYDAGPSFYSELCVMLGIILSMLFAILSILSVQNYSDVCDEDQKQKGKEALRKAINAIVFEVILSLFLMLYGLVIVVMYQSDNVTVPFDVIIIKRVLSGIAYYVFAVILLNLLLVVKQMRKLIEFNLEVKRGGQE